MSVRRWLQKNRPEIVATGIAGVFGIVIIGVAVLLAWMMGLLR